MPAAGRAGGRRAFRARTKKRARQKRAHRPLSKRTAPSRPKISAGAKRGAAAATRDSNATNAFLSKFKTTGKLIVDGRGKRRDKPAESAKRAFSSCQVSSSSLFRTRRARCVGGAHTPAHPCRRHGPHAGDDRRVPRHTLSPRVPSGMHVRDTPPPARESSHLTPTEFELAGNHSHFELPTPASHVDPALAMPHLAAERSRSTAGLPGFISRIGRMTGRYGGFVRGRPG